MIFKRVLLTGVLAATSILTFSNANVQASESLTSPDAIVSNFLSNRESKIENNNPSINIRTVRSDELDYLYDEAFNIIKLMEETTGRTLKDYRTDFKQTSSEVVGENTVITGELTQHIMWEGSGEETLMQDTVTFTISNKTKSVEESSFPKTEITGDELVAKAKASQAKYSTDSGLEEQKAREEAYTKHAGLDTTREEPTMQTFGTYTFDRSKVKAYALTYAINNNEQYWTFPNDCTNFASQALNAGGIPKQKIQQPMEDMPNWWMNTGAAGQWLYAVPWVQADSFFKLIRSTDTIHGYGKPEPKHLYEGDIISYDKGEDYTMNHTAVVTDRSNPENPLVSYHTTNRKNVPWNFYINNTAGSVIPYFTHIL